VDIKKLCIHIFSILFLLLLSVDCGDQYVISRHIYKQFVDFESSRHESSQIQFYLLKNRITRDEVYGWVVKIKPTIHIVGGLSVDSEHNTVNKNHSQFS
jgi:hypothetical protein